MYEMSIAPQTCMHLLLKIHSKVIIFFVQMHRLIFKRSHQNCSIKFKMMSIYTRVTRMIWNLADLNGLNAENGLKREKISHFVRDTFV